MGDRRRARLALHGGPAGFDPAVAESVQWPGSILLDHLVTRRTRSGIRPSCMTERLFVKIFRYETIVRIINSATRPPPSSSRNRERERERHAEEWSAPSAIT